MGWGGVRLSGCGCGCGVRLGLIGVPFVFPVCTTGSPRHVRLRRRLPQPCSMYLLDATSAPGRCSSAFVALVVSMKSFPLGRLPLHRATDVEQEPLHLPTGICAWKPVRVS